MVPLARSMVSAGGAMGGGALTTTLPMMSRASMPLVMPTVWVLWW